MKSLRSNWISIVLSLASFGLVLVLWERLPDPFPTHWNIRGEPNAWTPKPWGPLVLPLTTAGVSALLAAVPAMSPRKFSIEPFERTYRVIVASVVGILFAMTTVTTIASISGAVNIAAAIPVLIGVLFLVLGNFMGKLTRNFFVGIRTPWTLASDEVWLRTHRFGGKVFVASGAITIFAALLGYGTQALIASVAFASIASVVYSYVAHRQTKED